jgi:hypothetical protein
MTRSIVVVVVTAAFALVLCFCANAAVTTGSVFGALGAGAAGLGLSIVLMETAP